MPKLIIGGVDYGAYPTDAGDISYDNTSSGLSATKVQDAIDEIARIRSNNAGFHNSIYRGKSLGTSITAEQYAQISAGTFEDMYIGDYWTLQTTINNNVYLLDYVIAAFNYWNSWTVSSNHIVLCLHQNAIYAKMNATDTSSGGYYNSSMFTNTIPLIYSGLQTLFGEHLPSEFNHYDSALTNASGQVTGVTVTHIPVVLLSETMVCGHPVWSTSGYEVGLDRTILPLFAFDPLSATAVNARKSSHTAYWLRTVAGTSSFSLLQNDGSILAANASGEAGIKVAIPII